MNDQRKQILQYQHPIFRRGNPSNEDSDNPNSEATEFSSNRTESGDGKRPAN